MFNPNEQEQQVSVTVFLKTCLINLYSRIKNYFFFSSRSFCWSYAISFPVFNHSNHQYPTKHVACLTSILKYLQTQYKPSKPSPWVCSLAKNQAKVSHANHQECSQLLTHYHYGLKKKYHLFGFSFRQTLNQKWYSKLLLLWAPLTAALQKN